MQKVEAAEGIVHDDNDPVFFQPLLWISTGEQLLEVARRELQHQEEMIEL